jgi:hypothetical protein
MKRLKKIGKLVFAMGAITVAMVGTALLGLAGWGGYPPKKAEEDRDGDEQEDR